MTETEAQQGIGGVTDEMRALVGREFNEQVSYPVSASDIRRWAIAVHYPEVPPRLFWDEEYAAGTAHGGIVAPEDFNPFAWITASPGMSQRRGEFDPDYLEKLFGVAGPGSKANLNSGLTTEYGVRMRPGDVITSVSRIRGYEEKSGRMGRMILTTIESEWTNGEGALVKRTAQLSIRY